MSPRLSSDPSDPLSPRQASPEEPPPVLGSWRDLYLLTLGNLAFLVVIFWLITRAFA